MFYSSDFIDLSSQTLRYVDARYHKEQYLKSKMVSDPLVFSNNEFSLKTQGTVWQILDSSAPCDVFNLASLKYVLIRSYEVKRVY